MSDRPALQLSTRETEVLALAWQCFELEPKIDFVKFAALTGYTEGSAKVTIGNIKRKLKNHAGGVATPAATPKKASGKTPTASTKGKKRTAGIDNGDDESPTKKSKAQAKSKSKAKKPDDDDDEFAHVRIKKEEVRGVANDFEQYLAQVHQSGNGHGFTAVMDGLYAEEDRPEGDGYGDEYGQA